MRPLPVLRRLGALLATLLLAGAGVLVAAGPAAAEDTVGIGISPVNAHGETDGRSRFTYLADPGQTVTDQVRVSNAGTTSLKVTVSAADAYNQEDGQFALRPGGEKKSGAASWVTFDGKRELKLTLKRGESRVVAFTVAVPKDATPGDHAAGVLASATTTGQVTVERRIANRMYVRVSGTLQPILTLSSFTGTYNSGWNPFDGSITVNATITNSGNVALEGTTTLSASTWFGLGLGQVSRSEIPEILPGNTSTVTFQVADVPQVGYGVVSLLLQGGISGDAPDPGPLPVIQRDAFVPAMPWLPLGAIVMAVGVWLLLRRHRRREEAEAEEWMSANGLRRDTEATGGRGDLAGSIDARGDRASEATR